MWEQLHRSFSLSLPAKPGQSSCPMRLAFAIGTSNITEANKENEEEYRGGSNQYSPGLNPSSGNRASALCFLGYLLFNRIFPGWRNPIKPSCLRTSIP